MSSGVTVRALVESHPEAFGLPFELMAGAAGLDSDVVLYTGPGNSAFGHVTPSFATLSGVVTFSGGTGQFGGFEATVIVTYNPNTNLWYWDGTYRFNPPGD